MEVTNKNIINILIFSIMFFISISSALAVAPNVTITNDDFQLNNTDTVYLGFEDMWVDNITRSWIIVNGTETELPSNKLGYLFNYNDTIGYSDGIIRNNTPYIYNSGVGTFYEIDQELNYVSTYGVTFDNIAGYYGIEYDSNNDRIIAGTVFGKNLSCEYWNGTNCGNIATDLPNIEKWSLAKLNDYWYVVDGTSGFVYQFNSTWNYTGLSFDVSNGHSYPVYQIEATEDSLLFPDYSTPAIREYDANLSLIGTYSTGSRDYDVPFYTGKYLILSGAQINVFPPEMSVLSPHNFTVNLTEYLSIGNNSVQVKVNTIDGNFTSDTVYFNVTNSSAPPVYPDLDPTITSPSNGSFIPDSVSRIWIEYNLSQDINGLTYYRNGGAHNFYQRENGDRAFNLKYNGYSFWYAFYDDTHNEVCWTNTDGILCVDDVYSLQDSKTIDNCNTLNAECKGMVWDDYLQRYLWVDDNNSISQIESSNYDGSFNSSITLNGYNDTNDVGYIATDGSGSYWMLAISGGGYIYSYNSSFNQTGSWFPQELQDDGTSAQQIIYNNNELILHPYAGNTLYHYDTSGNFLRRESMNSDFSEALNGAIAFSPHGYMFGNAYSRTYEFYYSDYGFSHILQFISVYNEGLNNITLSLNNGINDTNYTTLFNYKFILGDAPTLSVTSPAGNYSTINVPFNYTSNKNVSEISYFYYSINGGANQSLFDGGSILDNINASAPVNQVSYYLEDWAGRSVTDTGSFNVSSQFAPVMQDVYITPSTLYPQSSIVGNCLATDADSSTLDYNYNWYRNGTLYDNGGQNGVASGTLLSTSLGVTLVESDVWKFSCQATDGNFSTGFTNSLSKTVQPNTAPIVTPTISTPVYDTGSLTAQCLVSDVNSDASTITWKIYRDTVLVDGGTYNNVASGTNKVVTTITSDDLLFGQDWIVECNAYDGFDNSGFTNSSTATVTKDDQPPSFSYVRIYPVVLANNSIITIGVKAIDANGDILNYSVGLVVNNVLVEGGALYNISSDSESNYTFSLSSFNESDNIYVNSSVTDGSNIDTDSSLTFVVHTNNNVPIINDIVYSPELFLGNDDDVLGYCNATDSDSDYIIYDYIWYINDVNVRSGTKSYSYIGSASGTQALVDTLPHSLTSEGDDIILSCRGYDTVNYGSYVNGSIISVFEDNNFAPEMVTSLIYGGTATTDTLFINASATDNDGQDVRFTYQIVKNGQLQTAVNTAYLTEGVEQTIANISSDDTTGRDSFYVRIRAYDGNTYSDWKNSNTVTIDNTAPITLNATISQTPYENTTLIGVCNANDIDDDTLTFEYIWYNGSSSFTTDKNLLYNYTQYGQTWTLSCRAYDGADYGTYVNSTGITILDSSSIPQIQSVGIVGRSTNITGTCLANDYDGDLIDYQFRWYKNGVLDSSSSINDVTQGATQSVVLTPTISVSDSWIFSCKSSDDLDGSSEWVNSSTMIVQSELFNYFVEDVTSTTIKINWNSNADTFMLYLNDDLVTTTSQFKYEFTGLLPSTSYNILIQPIKDNYYYVPENFNQTTDITDNNNPTMTSVTLTDTAYTDTTLVGKCKGTDIESSSIFYTYTWYVNDSVVASGVTALAPIDTFTNIPAISTSLYDFNDTVTLICEANDGLGTSTSLNDSVTILNSEPVISNTFIEINDSQYICSYSYSDADDDAEIFINYSWYLNDVLYGVSGVAVNVSDFSTGDELICQINTGDVFQNISQNTSTYVVGDFGSPILSDISYPNSVVFGQTAEIRASCVDDNGVGFGYPVVRFTNPNLVEQEYQLFYDSDNSYVRYLTLTTLGTYRDFEFECRDGNGNRDILQPFETLLLLDSETVVNIGGSSGGEVEIEPFRDIESFSITPQLQDVFLSSGSTIAVEFELENTDIVDIPFTVGIARNNQTPETYGWMSFQDNSKGVSFILDKSGGLDDNKRFVRYTISVPDNIEDGEYLGQINVAGQIGQQTQEGIYQVRINVGGNFFQNVFGFFNKPLFEIPLTATVTGAVTGINSSDVSGINATPFGIIIFLSAGGLIWYLIRRAKK